MTIEGQSLSPFWRPKTTVVTGSGFKSALYTQIGVMVENDPIKTTHVGRGEIRHDAMHGHGVVIRRREVDVPYPVLVARMKAKELAPFFKPNDHPHAVTDSTWEILSPEGHVLSLNKPGGDKKKEKEIVEALYEHRGQSISSDTGVCIILPNLREMELYHLTLITGIINPHFQVGQVDRLIEHNPDTSGGFSIIEALTYELIIPDSYLQFRVRKISPTGEPFISGRIMKYDAAIQELSSDQTNNEWIRRLAVGVMPRK